MESHVLTKIKTVLTAVVFWLGIAGAVIAVVLNELGSYVDQPAVAAIVGVLAPIATIITVLSLIIRRVTEVVPSDRGLLPLDYPTPAATARREALRDAGLTFIETILVVVIVVLAIFGLIYLF